MAHKISQLLGDAEGKIADEISRLEEATGYQGHDVRLISQSAQTARARIADLGLDPDDTTAEELYHSLKARYVSDARQLESDLGLSNSDNEEKQLMAMRLAGQALAAEEAWVLKPSVIRSLLTRLPPLKTKKALHFRSIDSMLKRTNPSVVLAVAHLAESQTWQTKWSKLVKNQPAGAHQAAKFSCVTAVLPNGVSTLQVPEAATVVVNASDPPDTLGQVLRAVEAVEEMTGRRYDSKLGQIHPALRWWNSNSHLTAWVGGLPVSFNIYDVAKDHNSGADFEKRGYLKAGESLWDKLSQQYDELLADIGSTENEFTRADVTPVMVAAEAENV